MQAQQKILIVNQKFFLEIGVDFFVGVGAGCPVDAVLTDMEILAGVSFCVVGVRAAIATMTALPNKCLTDFLNDKRGTLATSGIKL